MTGFANKPQAHKRLWLCCGHGTRFVTHLSALLAEPGPRLARVTSESCEISGLELLNEDCSIPEKLTQPIWDEADELIRIFVTMATNTKKRQKNK